jgi:hypothetical protein
VHICAGTLVHICAGTLVHICAGTGTGPIGYPECPCSCSTQSLGAWGLPHRYPPPSCRHPPRPLGPRRPIRRGADVEMRTRAYACMHCYDTWVAHSWVHSCAYTCVCVCPCPCPCLYLLVCLCLCLCLCICVGLAVRARCSWKQCTALRIARSCAAQNVFPIYSDNEDDDLHKIKLDWCVSTVVPPFMRSCVRAEVT